MRLWAKYEVTNMEKTNGNEAYEGVDKWRPRRWQRYARACEVRGCVKNCHDNSARHRPSPTISNRPRMGMGIGMGMRRP
jgi:hypothetical protein